MPRETSTRAQAVAGNLRQVVGALVRRVRTETRDAELSQTEQSVLRRLWEHGPTTTAALARAEWVKPQSMGATLSGLEAEGLVDRVLNATDSRCRNVSITEKGKRLLEQGRSARQDWLARAIDAQLNSQEQQTIVAALELLQRIVDA